MSGLTRARLVQAVLVLATTLAAVCAAVPPAAPPAGPPKRPRLPTLPTSLPATTAPTSRGAADAAIPKATLLEMYRRELGERYTPADADKVYATHELLERYFQATNAAGRKKVVGQIRATGVEPNLVGRLTRLRMYWPALDRGGVYYVNERAGPYFVRYFFGVPESYDRTRPWPLVIKLPTAEAFLTDPPPDAELVVKIYTAWVKDELAHHPDAIVVMPLLNLGELYGPSYVGMNSVIQPMLDVANRANVDPARVYLVGHSMAAHAAWNLALHYTTYFAAFDALAGGAGADWQRLRIVNLRNVLPVVWHDAEDQVIPVDSSRTLVRALRLQKVDVEYEETKGVGHVPDAAIVDRQYEKMRARNRDLYPAQLSLQTNRPDTVYNRLDWIQIWEPINGGKERNVFFKHGSGKMILLDNTFRIDGTRKGNHFDFTTQNVDGFRLYLNDQMVDFTQAVTVILNKKPVYEGLMTPDVEVMLNDQIFLGRGWRYFTAGFDIEIVAHPKWTPTTKSTTKSTTGPATGPTTGPATRKGRIIVGPSRD